MVITRILRSFAGTGLPRCLVNLGGFIMNQVPLRYQSTEYDCGNTAVLNALNYVLDFSEIPSSFPRAVYYISRGNGVASAIAIKVLSEWFNEHSIRTNFPLRCIPFEGDEVTFRDGSRLLELLQSKGTVAVVLRCLLYDEHYVTVTGADDRYIYFFDPYYHRSDYGEMEVFRVEEPMRANRRLPLDFMESTDGDIYSLSIKDKLAIAFIRLSEPPEESIAEKVADEFLRKLENGEFKHMNFQKRK